MLKIRAALVSTVLATALIGGAVASGTGAEAKAPIKQARDHSWCC